MISQAFTLDLWMILTISITCAKQNKHGVSTKIKPKEITELLNSLLKGYNKHLRPGFGGDPLEVETNILIRSMGPISEEQMTFSMDCYFRQTWRDARLLFKPHGALSVLRPSIQMLNEIWKPDTFFLNGQDSYLHTITYQNKLFRISENGNVIYSQRLTIKSKCPMFLHKYPMDSQVCKLYIGSYGYTERDVKYKWKDTSKPVRKYKDIVMAQFRLTDIQTSNNTDDSDKVNQYVWLDQRDASNRDSRSLLKVEFSLTREIGYFLLQIYLPCYLVVIISWVSFWINREDTPARVSLGITTLLTTCTIGLTGRTGIPKVSYSTALDLYLLMCFSYVFAALIEYAGVNYFTKANHTDPFADEPKEPSEKSYQNLQSSKVKFYPGNGFRFGSSSNGYMIKDKSQSDNCAYMFLNCLKGNSKYRYMKAKTKRATVSESKIDSISRIIFPFSFTCLNMLYWAGFMYYF